MKQRLFWVVVPTVATAAMTAALTHYWLPTRYRSEALVLVVPEQAPGHIEERLQAITQQVLSRTRLERIVNEFNLYPERRNADLTEGVVSQMRSRIGIQIVEGDAFRVSFIADDARTAMRVAERLTSLFIEENLRDRAAESRNPLLEVQIQDIRRQLIDTEAELRRLRATTTGELSQGDVLPYEVLKDSYKALLQKQLDARVGANLEVRQKGEQYRVLDQARLPETPVGPSKTAVNLGGTLAGLAFGAVVVGVSNRQKKPSTV